MYNVLVFKKNMHKPGHFPIHHSIWGEIFFLSMGQEKGFTLVLMQFSSFLRVRHSTPHFFSETNV